MSIITHYIKVAMRSLFKSKKYSIINITGLALGMVCCVLILLWVQDELSFDRFHKNNEHLYLLVNEYSSGWSATSPWSLAPTLKNDFPEIEKATRYFNQTMLVKYMDNSYYEPMGFVDADFLEMFSFPLLQGDAASALTVTSSVIISEKAARKYFPDEEPMGKVLTVNQSLNLTVTGIMKNAPKNSTLTFEMLAPVKNIGEQRVATWFWETGAFVQLKEKANVDELRAKMAGTAKKYDKRIENEKMINGLQPLARVHLYGLNNIGPILYIYIFSGVALIVLLVACINFVNLVTAKAFVRGKEIGIRKVVGAEKKQIIFQFYGETLLLSVFAFVLALTLVMLILPHFNLLAEKQLSLDFFHNPILLPGVVLIILITTLFAGSYPALLLSSFRPIQVLKQTTSRFKESTSRWILVVFQFTISIVFIVVTITMNRQLNYIQNMNLGFNREQVISIPMNDQFRSQYEAFKNRLQQYPEIINITAATSTPNNIGNVNPVYWQGRGPDQYEIMNYVEVDYDYFETFEMEFVDGRPFSREFPTDRQNYIVNQAALDYMKMDSPIGKLFSIWTNEGQIIGVVKNFHNQSLHNEISPVVMTFNQFIPLSSVFIRVSPENIKSTLTLIEKNWRELAPDYPFQYEFLDEAFHRQYLNEEKIRTLFQYFSSLAIFISCIGLFGLAAFVAQRRTKEFGIRKVSGATVFDIIRLMFMDFGKWLILALIIAIPVAYYAINKWLQNFAYHIDITFWIFVLSGGLALGIALLAICGQAIRAAMTNPIDALRYE